MDKKTFQEQIAKIGTIEDEVERRTLLASLNDEVSKDYDTIDTLNTTVSSLQSNLNKANEDLTKAQKANMELFLRVSSQKSDNDVKDDSVGEEHEKPKRKFEDLFKEGGK